MKKIEKIPSKIIEIELQIKLLDNLKSNKFIDNEMYSFVVNRLINKLSNEKDKTNNECKDNFNEYELIT